ncbi:hypothetical protein QSE00_04780 [Arenibacter sp. M-2]|uniref:hypothetical protein n=1 Tax=Arenibacter sp. M-2 TaxID=3053612 RepID=UPI0025702DB8|nr:hypothetical protein [Arenibacter sp. M-2]MDL5511117.1 hypothetical protein [Arenibacter sp. M-2]
MKLALWPRKSMENAPGITQQNPSALEFTLGHNVVSKEEVDAIWNLPEKQGQKSLNLPQKLSGVVTLVIFKTSTGTFGRLSTILSLFPKIDKETITALKRKKYNNFK